MPNLSSYELLGHARMRGSVGLTVYLASKALYDWLLAPCDYLGEEVSPRPDSVQREYKEM
ncbi:hypothetical protein KB1_13640 [Cutibacterium modestum]|uniref:Uncharacterized protein n=2 Tax=Cutibacterium modestum TaxID=2559073 RepID=A0AAD1NW42_9ACTN|nr:hypothetical protein KB1_13640 [Cutibacterium modestum]